MKVTEEMLEILIGKHLDSEITPSEQQVLEAALERDSRAKDLLEWLRSLHQAGRGLIGSQIIEPGKTAEQVIENAWQQRKKRPLRQVFKARDWGRFAAGLAAGILIGLALHSSLLRPSADQRSHAAGKVTAKNSDSFRTSPPLLSVNQTRNTTRNVDWYGFTDENGVQWLVEGFRENVVRPAVYDGDL